MPKKKSVVSSGRTGESLRPKSKCLRPAGENLRPKFKNLRPGK